MESVTPAPTLEQVQAVHSKAAEAISKLNLAEANVVISEEDHRALLDYYNELEQQRHTLLSRGAQTSVLNPEEDDEDFNEEILDAELKKAAEFPAFLKSLNPTEDATKILVLGSKHVAATLETIEKGANFLVDVPMQMIVDKYERIKSREERLKADGAPVSLVNAIIYLSETEGFRHMAEKMIMLDMGAPTVDEVSAAGITLTQLSV